MEAAVNISTFSPACQVSLQELHHLREAARLGQWWRQSTKTQDVQSARGIQNATGLDGGYSDRTCCSWRAGLGGRPGWGRGLSRFASSLASIWMLVFEQRGAGLSQDKVHRGWSTGKLAEDSKSQVVVTIIILLSKTRLVQAGRLLALRACPARQYFNHLDSLSPIHHFITRWARALGTACYQHPWPSALV